MQGILVTNAFLKTGKFIEHYEWLKEAANKKDIALEWMDNSRLRYLLETGECTEKNKFLEGMLARIDFVIFWDKDVSQGKILEKLCKKRGILVWNGMDAILACDNKFETYYRIWEWNLEKTQEEQVQILPTIVAPMTYENVGYTEMGFVEDIIGELGLPLVIKECFGSFGMQVSLALTKEQVYEKTKELQGKPFLYQKYASASAGRDVRLQVVGNRVVAAMYRYSENGDFRANITNGGSMKSYIPSERECELAVQVTKILGLDFAGVDLLFEEENSKEATIVCEVNSNAHFKNIFVCTGVNVADCIMEALLLGINGTNSDANPNQLQ